MLNTNASIDREEAESLVWLAFFMEVSVVKNYAEVFALINKQPLPNTPGRQYFENLGLFVQLFEISPSARAAELTQYLRIIRLIGPTLDLPALALPLIQEDLMKAIEQRHKHGAFWVG